MHFWCTFEQSNYFNYLNFHSKDSVTEPNYNLKNDWQVSGTSVNDLTAPVGKLGYRANELTPRTNLSARGRKTSIDVASDFFRNTFSSNMNVPPMKVDLAKAATNTRNFMTEISFLKDSSRVMNSPNVNTNQNIKSSISSSVHPTRNNNQMGNGINSKGLNNTMDSSLYHPNGGNRTNVMNLNLKSEEFPETVDVGTTINSRLKPSHGEPSAMFTRANGGDVNITNSDMDQLTNSDTAYPSAGQARKSHSQQIIATPHEPCCECIDCGVGVGVPYGHRDRLGDVTSQSENKGAPICVLFAIFLFVSIIVISCVMVYLKAGRT